jgi:acyl-CoA hydrolase
LSQNTTMRQPVQYVSAESALSCIQNGHRVFIHGSACTPLYLLRELAKQKDRLRDVELISITLQGDIELAKPGYETAFHINSLFVSAPIREAVREGRADFIPAFLSDIPDMMRSVLPVDVALVQVSPPDVHGYCSLGLSVDVARTAVNCARHVVAQVNPFMPRTHGDGMVHTSMFSAMVLHEEALPEVDYGAKVTDVEFRVGEQVASLVEDGSTLQVGIGAIPDAVLRALHSHKNLGMHTEMFSDGVIPLFEKDVINNSQKKIHPRKLVTAFALGTKKLYDYIHDNPAIAFLDIDYVNDPRVISRNPKVIAINSALEIDLTGQICADSIGTYQYSGIGGQMDFIRGAALSEGGKPIIALASRTHRGVSRIVPFLKPGAGVVTTRGHIHYVVTEYGVAYLYGKNLRQRAKALIDIAHPDDREWLTKSSYERFMGF